MSNFLITGEFEDDEKEARDLLAYDIEDGTVREEDIEHYQRAYDLYRYMRPYWRKSFFAFFMKAWSEVEPNYVFQNNWHIGLMSEYAHEIKERRIKKLVINIPPRYLKSMVWNICFPSWIWTTHPGHRFITSSYSEKLSLSLSFKRRQLIESAWFQKTWGLRVNLLRDQNQKGFYQNKARGFMFSTSTGGTVTGEGCDTMIIDDPIKPMDALSEVAREKAIDFWKNTLSSRFNDLQKSAVVLVMQRLHEKDLTGHFKEVGGCTELVIPNEAVQKITYVYPRSGKIKSYEVGEVLQPTRESKEDLERIRTKVIGSYNYAAQRLQSPAPLEGGLVKHNWLKFYNVFPQSEKITISIDCSFKKTDTSDFVAIHAYGNVGPNFYLLRRRKKKMGFIETIEEIEFFIEMFPNYFEILVEDKANGSAVIDTLKRKFTRVIAINPKDSKVSRLNSCSPVIEGGALFLPTEKLDPSINDFIYELTTFPNAANDDEVDALTQFLNRAQNSVVASLASFENSGQSTLVGSLSSNNW